MIRKAAAILVLLLLVGCGKQSTAGQEMALRETLVFAGIDPEITVSKNAVGIEYDIPVEREEDVLLSVFYIFGAAYNEFPDRDYTVVFRQEDYSYYFEADSKDVGKFLDQKINADEFREEVNVWAE